MKRLIRIVVTVTFLVSYTQYYTPESRILQNALLHYSFKQPTTSSIFWKSIRTMSVFRRTFPSLLLSFPSRRLLLFCYQSMRLRIVVCFVSPFSYFILTRRHTFATCVHSSVSSSLDIPLFSGDFMNNSILPFFMASSSPSLMTKKRSMIFFLVSSHIKNDDLPFANEKQWVS